MPRVDELPLDASPSADDLVITYDNATGVTKKSTLTTAVTAGGVALTGPPGAPGAVWRNGSGVPSNALGIAGDYYLNNTNDDVYYKASTTYSVVTNIKGSSGAGTGDALVANPLSQFAATTSAQLRGVISDETGTGAAVFGTSPTLSTPVGLVKSDVGLGNVDNTSDITKNSASVTLTNKTLDNTNTVTLKDTLFTIQDDGDATKQAKLQLSGLTTATTRTYTLPDVSDTLVTKTTTDTLTNKRITPRTATVASSATPTINTDNTDFFTITALAVAITSFTTNLSGTPTEGQRLMIRIKDNGTARAITWGASFASRGGTLPATTTISKILYVGLIWNVAASTWDCVAATVEA